MSKNEQITIVTPSFEKHFVQYCEMIESLDRHCSDLDRVRIVVVVEEKNRELFSGFLDNYPRIASKVILTEDVLARFGAVETPGKFLGRAGKFLFQALKKFGGLLEAETEWSLVLDSETVFVKDFSILEVLQDYKERKYVFYTQTAPRGELWTRGDSHRVNCNVEAVLGVPVRDAWFMECFHWFYEKSKVEHLLNDVMGELFFRAIQDPSYGKFDLFENVIYYAYLRAYHAQEYTFLDFKAVLDAHLPPQIAARFELSKLPFALFGNDYLLSIFRPSEIALLTGLFKAYKIPFLRLDPPYFHTDYLKNLKALPHLVATVSSHHQIWLKKKIAVCISGEFRHLIHRVPEQQIRFLKAFLSGVECDVFIHGWHDPNEALIVEELQPKRHLFEHAPDVDELAAKIRYREPLLKDGRDRGSLLMFYSMQKCFELIGDLRDDYEYVVRIRPDIFMERSLKELLVSICDEGDFQPEAVYVPSHFHSKGINDQFALGRMEKMERYFHSFDYAKAHLADHPFNPEMVLLRNLLESKASVCLVHAPYALLRHLPMRVDTIHEALRVQRDVWWSRNDGLPLYTDLSAFLAEKLKSIDVVLTGQLATKLYLPLGDGALVEAMSVDYDPMWRCCLLRPINGLMTALHFEICDGAIVPGTRPAQFMFLFLEGDDYVLSQWNVIEGKLINERIVLAGDAVRAVTPPRPDVLNLAWRLNRNLIDGQPLAEKITLVTHDAGPAAQAAPPAVAGSAMSHKIADLTSDMLSLHAGAKAGTAPGVAGQVLQQMLMPDNFLGKLLTRAFARVLRPEPVSVFTLGEDGMRSNSLVTVDGIVHVRPQRPCHALFGPYIDLDAGHYYAEFFFDAVQGGEVTIDVRADGLEDIARRSIAVGGNAGISIEWTLPRSASHVEIRLAAGGDFDGVLNCLLIRKSRRS
ncbi:hypothetical protein MTR62_18225 [Novosphingobium sp. 1949]|uniref:Uncharacterized protein n=1 Tax=Novosphingobium organovorum TaxID=2930092 RepID=A0ABT0BHV7_9SPHN|nr:hypothetical protein [Novosphingobium organovorum]MCJ2184609.1 hypothetical protein [Novosphingobium organovorum]